MSPRFNKGDEGFRPWKRGEDRDDAGFSGHSDRHEGGRGGFDRPPPWKRDRDRDGDRGGFGRGGFDRRPPWKRDHDDRDGDRGGFGRGGFDRRPPWKRDHDDRDGDRGGFGRGGFDRRPPWKRDRDDRDGDRGGFGRGGFDRRPPWKRDRDDRDGDRGGFGRCGFDRRPPWKRDRDDRDGAFDRGGFDRRPPWKRDRDEDGWHRDDRFEDEPPAAEVAEDQAVEESAEEAHSAPKRTPDVPEGELIYGRQPVRELLRSGRRTVHKLILADGVKESEEVSEIEALANERTIDIERRPRETLDAWLNGANHQGVLVACADYPYAEVDEIVDAFLAKEGNALLVLLDHVVDPQNLGSLVRTCETAGVSGVILPIDRAVGVTPAVVRASAGATEHLPIACVASLPDVILRLKEAKDASGEPVFVDVVGLEGADDPKSEAYTDIDYKGKVTLVVGSEGLGLGKLVKERCDHLAKLPMFGKVSSLNAGVAGAIAIYEVLRQQA